MDGTRLAALLAAIIGVLLLGHVLYQAVQFGRFAFVSLGLGVLFAGAVSLGLGVLFAGAAELIRRRAPRG